MIPTLVALLVLSATASAAQPPARDVPSQAGTAVIRGRVLDDKDAPLRRVVVTAAALTLRLTRSILTDADGRYELKTLPAGKYTVSASKTHYVRQTFGEQRPAGPGTPFDVAEGQTVGRIDFRLVRSGIIVGRVLDEFSEPVADVEVSALRHQIVESTRRLTVLRRASTNDLGEYRLYGLAPDVYYIAVAFSGFNMESTADRLGYAPTYYPGTANAAEAEKLTIAAGRMLSGIDVTLRAVRTARISGTAVDRSSRPLAGRYVFATQRFGGGAQMRGARVQEDGSFVLEGVTPGDYTLSTTIGTGNDSEAVNMRIAVGGDDITGVSLVTAPLSVVKGRVVFDGAVANAPKPSTIRVTATPVEGMPGGSSTMVKDDSTFELRLLPGHLVFRVAQMPLNWRLKRVRLGDTDVTDPGYFVTPAGAGADLVVEITDSRTELSGTVTTSAGEPARHATVILFAQDPEHWGPLSRFLALASASGPESMYRVRLTPGAYYAIALADVDRTEWNTPEFLRQIRDRAVTFSIADGEVRRLDLKLQQ